MDAHYKYSKEQIVSILKNTKFEYHRVDLPYGLHTPGADRSETRDIVLPASLDGKTVLDVGCALGYFCFEAEKRFAKRVVGVELSKKRFEQALLLKKILDSKVEFVNTDVVSGELVGEYDYVLCLNLLHHVKEPMILLRKLAKATREKLVIEVPTLSDRKFCKTLGPFGRFLATLIDGRLPVIGVSSLSDRAIDQTFVFSKKAIERILINHESLFKVLHFHQSPMKNRLIVICDK